MMLNGCGTPYLIKWRLNNKSAKIRQQAADLIARIAVVMKVREPVAWECRSGLCPADSSRWRTACANYGLHGRSRAKRA